MQTQDHVHSLTVPGERPWFQWYEENVAAKLSIPHHTLPALLKATAQQVPKRDAIRFFGRGISYQELDESVNRCANALIELGVEPGDRVTLVMPNSPQMVMSYYGALRAGAIVVPTNPLYTSRELYHQLTDSGTRVVICLSRMFDKLQEIREDLPDLEHVIVTSIKDFFPFFTRMYFTITREKKEGHHVELPDDGRTYWLTDILNKADENDPGVTVSAEDTALLQYTAGTTGTPNGVMLSHRNMGRGVTCQGLDAERRATFPGARYRPGCHSDVPPARPDYRHELST